MPRASVIVLTYSHWKNIPRIAEALKDDDVELIVAEDGTNHWADGPHLHYSHPHTQPWQCSKARNGGAKLATTPYLLFLDDDYLPEPGWVDAHLNTLRENDVSMGVYDPEYLHRIQYDITRWQAVEEGLCAVWQVAYSGNLGVRAQAWRDVGGFDERFGGNYGSEDTDFGRMLFEAGKRFAFSHDAKARCISPHTEDKPEAEVMPNMLKLADKWRKPLRVMLVFPGHEFSTYEVARGYAAALRHLGCVVCEFPYHEIFRWYKEHLDQTHGGDQLGMALQIASQQLASQLLDHLPDVVLNVCGMALSPVAYHYAYQLGIPMVLALTESPYCDAEQAAMLQRAHAHACTVNDKVSLEFMRGLCRAEYLPHSYDPLYHYPRAPRPGMASDVVFIGSMYLERQQFFDNVNWDGIKLKLVSTKVARMGESAAITGGIGNTEAIEWYRASKIGLTLHRTSIGADIGDKGWGLKQVRPGEAWSIGPRTYELAAVGLMQLSDSLRSELFEIFGDSVPTFDIADAAKAERLIRFYLSHDAEREALRLEQMARVMPCSFENRAREILLPLLQEVSDG